VTIKECKERRAKLIADSKAILDKATSENRPLSAEEAKADDALAVEIDKINEELSQREDADRRAERQSRYDSMLNEPARRQSLPGNAPPGREQQPAVTDEHSSLAIQAWFRSQTTTRLELSERHQEACRLTGLNPNSRELCIQLLPQDRLGLMAHAFQSSHPAHARSNAMRAGHESLAMSSITIADGGGLRAPESMVSSLEVNMLAYGGVLQVAEIMRTGGRERLRWPTVDDTAQQGRRIGESGAVSAATNPTIGAIYWDAYKYTSDEILVPYELLTGTPYNLPAILGEMMGTRIGRKLAVDFTTGTGVNEPGGLITKATSFSAASATAISWDDLENLISAVDPSYRIGASFMFHDSIRSSLMKLKDGEGRPLWAAGPNGTAPGDLKGYPWYINQAMDSTIASGKKTISFGQHSKYKVRQVDTIRIYRLVERYRENDQDAFLAFLEADGNLLNAGTAPVKYLSH